MYLSFMWNMRLLLSYFLFCSLFKWIDSTLSSVCSVIGRPSARVPLLVLTIFCDVINDLLNRRHTSKWNLHVLKHLNEVTVFKTGCGVASTIKSSTLSNSVNKTAELKGIQTLVGSTKTVSTATYSQQWPSWRFCRR